jgi:DNA-directed RNA polymerase sigma subunit (sigma70/sigma32)
MDYSLHHSRLISMQGYTMEQIREHAPTFVSIDELSEDELEQFVVQFESPLTEHPEFDTIQISIKSAFQELTEKQRDILNRHLGLNGYPAEAFIDVSKADGLRKNVPQKRYLSAIARLRTLLGQA